MPQINRIRVNNVKYNFGTQFYDDFMMSFSCKNTIYDLANGGGKSVLMLLLLQNLIPNCTLDEKQPIEKLFRTQGGSSVIHSLVEWKLEGCYQTDGYRYMTTGFCARKAKDMGEENSRETAGIEYFNYCIFYKEFGDNDIRNLPLSSDGQRITYNGLKNYLRELDKSGMSVMVRIFDRKGDYQNFIAQYGLFESHWEIVRGINKTEGHVRAYFETNYRTARKVIEDLLIEEIIQTSYRSRIGISGDDDDMARTLMDIKDKLVELARKKEQIVLYDRQIEAMEGFAGRIREFRDIMEEKAVLKNKLADYLLQCRRLIADTAVRLKKHKEQREEVFADLQEKRRKIAVAQVLEEQQNLDRLNEAAKECKTGLELLYAQEQEKRARLALWEAAGEYKDYLEYQRLRGEVMVTIENSMRDRQEVVQELYALAAKKKLLQDKELAVLQAAYDKAKADYDKAKLSLDSETEKKHGFEITAAVFDSNVRAYEKRLLEEEKRLADMLTECGILVAEDLQERLSYEKETLEEIAFKKEEDKRKLSKAAKERDEYRNELIEKEAAIRVLRDEQTGLKERIKKYDKVAHRLSALSAVYKETEAGALVKTVYNVYKNQLKALSEEEMQISRLEDYMNNLKDGKLDVGGRQYKAVEEYLKKIYGEDVIGGRQWFMGLSSQLRRDIIKRVPFVEYSLVVKGDFERVREDAGLKSFLNCSYVVPVISENIIYSTRLGFDSDNIVFGMQDLQYLRDENKLSEVLGRAEEELEEHKERKEKLEDRLGIIEEDYVCVSEHAPQNEKLRHEAHDRMLALEEEQRQLEERRIWLRESAAKKEEEMDHLTGDILAADGNYKAVNEKHTLLLQAVHVQEEIQTLREDCRAFRSESAKSHAQVSDQELVLASLTEEYEKIRLQKRRLEETIASRSCLWQEQYAAYYREETEPFDQEMPEADLDSRFLGLKAVVENAAADVNDKWMLVKTYETSMDKCLKAIEYRGFVVDRLAADYEKGIVHAVGRQRLLDLKEAIREVSDRHMKLEEEYNARSAQINRVEGSISHAIHLVEENYGTFEAFECDNVTEFITGQKQRVRELDDRVKALDKEEKLIVQGQSDYRVIERDILRVTEDAGIEMPEDMVYGEAVEPEQIADYEQVEKQFNVLVKNEFRRREEFLKERQRLADTLNGLHAEDLAAEVLRSLNVPQDVRNVEEMLKGIAEMNQCIALERDGISAGIENMEKIKDSFENRCIHTCVNIRSELDRLPQLSRITMDDETISIISLSIPYVKEEAYKERMSSYINDTISLAENFKEQEEKIKYIRGRLAWKKLFSVIVSDMNQVRINLYKRERIRSQSRYLRYEEAVGSTGQSQGIYIQFLIAVINYIASINAAGKEVSVLGKAIFIDNPFGAAKDVYIWEPIFKMLQTNHVQLIVPARGVTPAITGRFDVNYVLGQKLCGQMQQTVVVDYMSNVAGSELEYTKISFEQASLFD